MTAAAALKADKHPVIYTPRPFELPHIQDRGQWLLARMRDIYPHKQDSWLLGWVRSLIGSNETFFVQTNNAVGLAQVVHDTLLPRPSVAERFVFKKKDEPVPDGASAEQKRQIEDTNAGYMEEALSIYDAMFRWAFSIGADKIEVDVFTDVPRPMIQKRIGRIYMFERYCVRVASKPDHTLPG